MSSRNDPNQPDGSDHIAEDAVDVTEDEDIEDADDLDDDEFFDDEKEAED